MDRWGELRELRRVGLGLGGRVELRRVGWSLRWRVVPEMDSE